MRTITAVALLLALTAVAPHVGHAADEAALKKMVSLNKKALAAFEAGKHEAAKKHLGAAVALAEKSGLADHDIAARTFVHLGVVHLAGLHDRQQGLTYFNQALKVKPAIELTPSLATASLTKDFDEARAHAATVGKKDEGLHLAKTTAPKEAAPPEPDLPARIPQPIYCPVPDEGPPGVDLDLLCAIQPRMKVSKLTVFFRASGGDAFQSASMTRNKKGWYRAVIPAAAVSGRSFQFYFEARGPGNKVAAMNGRDDLPNVMMLRSGAAPVGAGTLVAASAAPVAPTGPTVAEEAPYEVQLKEKLKEPPVEVAPPARRTAGSIFAGIGFGNGYGWFPARQLEHQTGKQASGAAPGGVGHLTVEGGYQLSDDLAIAAQLRIQYLPISGTGDSIPGAAPQSALAVLVHAYRTLWTGEHLQLLATGSLGAGSAFRVKVNPDGDMLRASDTIAGGPIALGLGGALFYNFSHRVLAAVELRGLAGVPKIATFLELSAGVQVNF